MTLPIEVGDIFFRVIFRETVMIHLLLWGNSFSQIIRDGMRRVVGLYPLLPNRMSVDRDEHGELVYTYTPMSDSNPNLKSGQPFRLLAVLRGYSIDVHLRKTC